MRERRAFISLPLDPCHKYTKHVTLTGSVLVCNAGFDSVRKAGFGLGWIWLRPFSGPRWLWPDLARLVCGGVVAHAGYGSVSGPRWLWLRPFSPRLAWAEAGLWPTLDGSGRFLAQADALAWIWLRPSWLRPSWPRLALAEAGIWLCLWPKLVSARAGLFLAQANFGLL
jgi:hypothetical protein